MREVLLNERAVLLNFNDALVNTKDVAINERDASGASKVSSFTAEDQAFRVNRPDPGERVDCVVVGGSSVNWKPGSVTGRDAVVAAELTLATVREIRQPPLDPSLLVK